MSAGKNSPSGPRIVIGYGSDRAAGMVAGLTVGQVRIILSRDVPGMVVPDDAEPHVATLDPAAPAWRAVSTPENPVMVSLLVNGNLALIGTVGKLVPEDYVIRDSDIFLMFLPPRS